MLQNPLPPPPPLPIPPNQIVVSKQPRNQPISASPPLPIPPNQIVISKQPRHQPNSASQPTNSNIKSLLQHPRPRRTNPVVWCVAIFCFIFSLTLIIFGIATLIIYLVIRPRNPFFDTPNARLNSIYFDSPELFNGDLTFLANFSNPNRKIDVRFEYVEIELYFFDRLIGIQALDPFTQRRKEARLESVHVVSSLVYLPQNLSMELQKQVQNNKVVYTIRGTFKVRAMLGLVHYSYWLHGRCEIEMSGPPTGVLLARNCKTKR